MIKPIPTKNGMGAGHSQGQLFPAEPRPNRRGFCFADGLLHLSDSLCSKYPWGSRMKSRIGDVVHKVIGTVVEVKEEDGDAEGDAPKGEVLVRLATTGVKDLDGDVIVKGAFGKQSPKIAGFGHDWTNIVGKGETYEQGDGAFLKGRYFLTTQKSRDDFTVIKELGSDGEWSFGFRILDGEVGKMADDDVYFIKGMEVFEASPVIKGASIDSRTIEAKSHSCGCALPCRTREGRGPPGQWRQGLRLRGHRGQN